MTTPTPTPINGLFPHRAPAASRPRLCVLFSRNVDISSLYVILLFMASVIRISKR